MLIDSQLYQNHAEALVELAKSLTKISRLLPRVEIHVNLFPLADMQAAAEELYSLLIEQFERVLKFYEENPWKHAWKSFISPYSLRFEDLDKSIDASARHLESLAVALHHQSTQAAHQAQFDMLLDIVGRLSTIEGLSRGHGNQLHCEYTNTWFHCLSRLICPFSTSCLHLRSALACRAEHAGYQACANDRSRLANTISRTTRRLTPSSFALQAICHTEQARPADCMAVFRSEPMEYKTMRRNALGVRVPKSAKRNQRGGDTDDRLRPDVQNPGLLGSTNSRNTTSH